MSADEFQRRLAAILSADAVGYSRLMAEDEVSTVRLLNAHRSGMMKRVGEHRGRVSDFVGDNMLAEFSSAHDAVKCAVEIQRNLAHHNKKLSPGRRLQFRIGIHLGDIMFDGERLYGDGVNLAARLEPFAEPGGICISDIIYKQVHNKFDLEFIDIGQRPVKNIPEPVKMFRIIDVSVTPNFKTDQAAFRAEKILTLPDKPSLAVLPFVNLSNDPEQEYFCDGLTMDIMTALVKISGLFLISEGSMYTFKSKPVTINELGAQLGVRYALESGVRKSGNRVRITSQLIEVSNGHRVWAERYDRLLDNLFALQDEITESIAAAMDVQLVSGESAHRVRRILRNPMALDLYYRGWHAMFGTTKEELSEAQRMFQELIRLEPASSIGYGLAAWAYWSAAAQGLGDSISVALERATELAQKALTMQDASGFPHIILAHVHLHRREYDLAISAVKQASLERPGCGGTFALKANILNYLDRPNEAIALAKTAIRITPLFPRYYPEVLAKAYYGSSRNVEAVELSKEILRRDPNNLEALLVLAGASVVLGQISEAQDAIQRLLKVNPAFTVDEFASSHPYKNQQTMDKMIARLQKAGLP